MFDKIWIYFHADDDVCKPVNQKCLDFRSKWIKELDKSILKNYRNNSPHLLRNFASSRIKHCMYVVYLLFSNIYEHLECLIYAFSDFLDLYTNQITILAKIKSKFVSKSLESRFVLIEKMLQVLLIFQSICLLVQYSQWFFKLKIFWKR